MTGNKGVVAVSVLALSVFGSSCASPETLGEPPPPMVVQALVDLSGSYEALPDAVRTLSDLVDQLRPGDRMTIRRINEASYRASAEIADVEVPVDSLGAKRFDPVAQAGSAATKARADSLRSLAKARIEALLGEKPAPGTDIVGSLAAAEEALRHQSRGRHVRPVILLFTDGKDTGPNRRDVELDLEGVEVLFLHFELPATVPEQRQLREWWLQKLEVESGAARVTFVPSSERISLRG